MFLGIDTGGTYTDAVILDKKYRIVSSAKAFTTKHDLSIGINNAIASALPDPPPQIDMVSLSSTLATNAIVEGKGSPVCLILIGYDRRILVETEFHKLVSDKHIVFLNGGHTVSGEEQAPLDISTAQQAILKYAPQVSAFAISSYFSVRNPAHELTVKKMVRHLTNLPVTCGHELTTELDAPLRAITVVINARLISLMQQLIYKVREVMQKHGIRAPIMIVKGDGSLIDAAIALERPVETILSGPAASVIGALHLCKVKNGFVVDIGGTTTDVAMVENNTPTLNHQGAVVGGWQTMVEALNVHTTGLGGDSEVQVTPQGRLIVGPHRVLPLCNLAANYPSVTEVLRKQLDLNPGSDDGYFVMREREISGIEDNLTQKQLEIYACITREPVAILKLLEGADTPYYNKYSLSKLIEQGLVSISAFTPTDAVQVLGQYLVGVTEASDIGAQLLARRLNIDKKAFCKRVFKQVVIQAGKIVLDSVIAEESPNHYSPNNNTGAQLFINRALGAEDKNRMGVQVSLEYPLIGVGAPAVTYMKPLARRLNTGLLVPRHAEVANAIGSVVAGVIQHVRILVRKPAGIDNPYRVYAPTGPRDFIELEKAVAFARKTARRLVKQNALAAGAHRVKVYTKRKDEVMAVQDSYEHLGTEIVATAVGNPHGDTLKRGKRDGSH